MRKEASYLSLGIVIGVLATATCFVFIQRSVRSERGGAGSARVLRLAHVLDQSHPVHMGMEFMAERAAELSGGAMEIQIFPNGQLGSETDCVEQVQRGALAMAKTSAAAIEGFVPEMAVFGLPYLFRDNDHLWQVLNGEVGRELLAAGEDVGIHGLCYYDSGSRSFYTVGHAITSPEKLEGEKVRVMASRMSMDMVSSMRGSPTPIAFGELYTALQQGMVDGAENNPTVFLSSRHYEVAKHYSLDEHTTIPDIVVFSQSIWEDMTPQERSWLNQAAHESVEYQRALWAEKVEEALEKVQAEGVRIYRPDKAPFVEATAPMYEQYKGTEIGILGDRIKGVE